MEVITVPDLSNSLHEDFGRSLGHITRHSAVFLTGTLFTMGIGYFVKIYVVRILGAELLGVYALGMTLVGLMQLFGLFGLPGTVSRYIAVYTATGKLDQLHALLTKSSAFVLIVNLAIALGLAFRGDWIANHLYHSPELARYMPAFSILMWLGALSGFYAQVLAGFKDIARRTIITNFIGTPVVLLLTLGFLAAGARLWGYLAAQVVGSGVAVVLLLRAGWKLTPPSVRKMSSPMVSLDREVFSFSGATFAMNGIDFLTTQADKILIGIYLAARPVGIYVLASTLAALVPLILQSVNQIFAPVIADLHARGKYEVLERLFQTLTKWVLASTLPLGAVVIVFAPDLMRLFGEEFASGWPVLVIVALGQVVNCAVGSVGYLLLMSGNQRRLIKVQTIAAVVSVVVNLTLIPVCGILGAAVAAAGVNVGTNLWNLIEVRRTLHISPYNRGYYKLTLPTGLMITSLALLRLAPFPSRPWAVALGALVVSYGVFGGAALMFGMDSEDRRVGGDVLRQMRFGLQRLRVIV